MPSSRGSNAVNQFNWELKQEQPLQLGDRVLWITPSNKRELGCVRWIGHLADEPSTELMIGVEFVSSIIVKFLV